VRVHQYPRHSASERQLSTPISRRPAQLSTQSAAGQLSTQRISSRPAQLSTQSAAGQLSSAPHSAAGQLSTPRISSRPAQHPAYQQPASSARLSRRLSQYTHTADSQDISTQYNQQHTALLLDPNKRSRFTEPIPDAENVVVTSRSGGFTVTIPETTAASPHSFPHSVIHMSGEQIAGNIQHHWNNSQACSSESATAFRKHQRTPSPMPYPGPHDTTRTHDTTRPITAPKRR